MCIKTTFALVLAFLLASCTSMPLGDKPSYGRGKPAAVCFEIELPEVGVTPAATGQNAFGFQAWILNLYLWEKLNQDDAFIKLQRTLGSQTTSMAMAQLEQLMIDLDRSNEGVLKEPNETLKIPLTRLVLVVRNNDQIRFHNFNPTKLDPRVVSFKF